MKTNFKIGLSLMVLLLLMVSYSCQKNNQTQPSPSNNNGNNNNGGGTPTSIAAQQQLIQGNWVLRRTENFNQNMVNGQVQDSLLNYSNYYSPSTCYLNLTSTPNPVYPYLFEANGSLGCNPYSLWWKISSLNVLDYNGMLYQIEFLNNDSLVLFKSYSPSVNINYHLNRTGNPPTFNSLEQVLAKNWLLLKREIYYGSSLSSVTNFSSVVSFLNQWESGGGYKVTGGTPVLAFGWNTWQVVQGRLRLGSTHYLIDSINSSKLVISTYPIGGMIERYTFQ